tara:strand:- start:1345 stop:1524 length:180 start_codon:yes stop_codon:yes gene_type:complete
VTKTGGNNAPTRDKPRKTRDTKGHYDVPMRDCTIMLDNDVVIEKGIIKDKNMVVERIQR